MLSTFLSALLLAIQLSEVVHSAASDSQHSALRRQLPKVAHAGNRPDSNGTGRRRDDSQHSPLRRGLPKVDHPANRLDANVRRDVGTSQKADIRSASVQFVRTKHGKADDDEDDVEVINSYEGLYSSHAWIRQSVRGIPVVNTMATLTMDPKGDVRFYGSNLVPVKKSTVSKSGFVKTPKITRNEAIQYAYNAVGGMVDTKRPPTLAYLADDNGDLKLIHVVRMHLPNYHVHDTYVDAVTGDVRGSVDYTCHLTLRAVPVTDKDIGEAGQVLLSNVEDLSVSPHGWTAAPGGSLPVGMTLGNNVVAAFVGNFTTLSSPSAAFAQNVVPISSDGVFDYKADLKADPKTSGNREAAVIHAFYAANMAHDILYHYGFDESSFNFQIDNFESGGQPSDPVLISVQDTGEDNSALFTTLPDGQASYLQTFLFNMTSPGLDRDSTLDNTIILHEYAHGLTNRMTGGGTAACLQALESAGLGEGWSDAFAEWVWQTGQTTFSDFIVGAYTSGKFTGLRTYPYSVNQATNPLTYGMVPNFSEPHLIGEVWAQALHIVHANLVREFGTATDALTNPDGENGHAVFLHLMIDALRIQPCNPRFIAARLAIIEADLLRYAGKHKCNLWNSFAYVGLGVDAKDFVESTAVPSDCVTKEFRISASSPSV